ncbi:MAG: hypothetical protein GWM87_00335 [Xanthomonadales bacterium]|nr:protein BatD [Xanthomonadales bacterium]NIX11557.1 hypothetical protein [Xanthomonadales bacterium]
MTIGRIRRAGALLLAALALSLVAAQALAAEVTARVDRDRVIEGETISLILQTSDPQQSLDTDLSVLVEDFEVLGQRSETQMSIVNGRQEAVVRQLITLEPKRSGAVVIPPLQFAGGARTRPVTVVVEPAPELAPGEQPPVFIELELDPADGPHYVHAQLSLTVRIYYQQNLTEAAINPPAPQPASVRLLDEIPFQAERNGVRYRVLERRYAIFPERSGEMTIPPLQLSGRLIERPSDRLWQPAVRGRRVRVESDPITVTVQPRPADYSGEHWLPARRITLSQQLSDSDGLRVGEPVTRSVIVDAVGLEENMLEEPRWPEVEHSRIYPDQPQGISRDDGQWVLGHKEFRYAVVPEEPGELVLPEVRLDWWDTVANRQRTAVLPEHRIQVARSELVPEAAVPLPPAIQQTPRDRAQARDVGAPGFWRPLSLVFALLWLGTLLIHLRGTDPKRTRRTRRTEIPEAEADLLKRVRDACMDGDAARAGTLLRRWVKSFGPPQAHGSVMEFAGLAESDSLREAIYRLDATGYSASGDGSWEGRDLWSALSGWRKGGKESGSPNGDDLPGLYDGAAR